MKNISPSLRKLIKLLNDGDVHSGSEMGERLNISRNAVWKHINQLEKYGIEIETVQSKGYCLKQPLILLDSKAIKKYINHTGKFKLNKIHILGSVSSTQDYIKAQTMKNPFSPVICLTEHQSVGRGRFGRLWHSPFGSNIYLSCGWQVSKDVSHLNGLSLVIALAIAETLQELKIKDIAIKWPNDIMVHNKKLGGVLVEIRAESYGITQVIIGIGINVNMIEREGKNIDRPWISLQQILGKYQDRNKIVGLFIQKILRYLENFDQYNFNYFIPQWKHYDYLFGKNIILHFDKRSTCGIAIGVNDQGHLLLETEGKINKYSTGEASLSGFKAGDL